MIPHLHRPMYALSNMIWTRSYLTDSAAIVVMHGTAFMKGQAVSLTTPSDTTSSLKANTTPVLCPNTTAGNAMHT
jgi:hypothetical protein